MVEKGLLELFLEYKEIVGVPAAIITVINIGAWRHVWKEKNKEIEVLKTRLESSLQAEKDLLRELIDQKEAQAVKMETYAERMLQLSLTKKNGND